jgi:hypothetical protein
MSKVSDVGGPVARSLPQPVGGGSGRGFAARLKDEQSQDDPAQVSGADIVASAVAEAQEQADTGAGLDARATGNSIAFETRLDDKQAASTLFQKNPFGPPDPQEAATIAALLSSADPSTLNARLIRLQVLMQREELRFEFESNTLKSDNDGNKEIINNVR